MGFMFGNAPGEAVRGWFIGQFVPAEAGLRCRDDVELKWGVHPTGDNRGTAWATYRTSTTISILVDEGQLLVRLRVDGGEVQEVLLKEKGDYLIIEPGVEHTWEAPVACTILSVRFPSVAGDQVERTE